MENRFVHKRRRKGSDDKNHQSRKCKESNEGASTNASSSSNNTPSWAINNNCSLIPMSATVYGNCPNVSSRYEKIGRIGEGTYGVVYRARDKKTGEIVALKRCLPHHEASDGFPLTTLREITLLRELQDGGKDCGIVVLKDVAVSCRCVWTCQLSSTIYYVNISRIRFHFYECLDDVGACDHKSFWGIPYI